MTRPEELAPVIGKMVVNGKTIEGQELVEYLRRMPYDDIVSLISDITRLAFLDQKEQP